MSRKKFFVVSVLRFTLEFLPPLTWGRILNEICIDFIYIRFKWEMFSVWFTDEYSSIGFRMPVVYHIFAIVAVFLCAKRICLQIEFWIERNVSSIWYVVCCELVFISCLMFIFFEEYILTYCHFGNYMLYLY